FSSRRRHTRCYRDWSSDVCSSDLPVELVSRTGSNVHLHRLPLGMALLGSLHFQRRFYPRQRTHLLLGLPHGPLNPVPLLILQREDRQSTRLNSSHGSSSSAVRCLQ